MLSDDGTAGRDGSLAESVASYGPHAAITDGLRRVSYALKTDPDLAASLIGELWPIAESDGSEFLRGEVLDLQLKSLHMRAARLGVLARPARRSWWRGIPAHRGRRASGGTGQPPAAPDDPLAMLGIAAGMLEHGDRSARRELVHSAIAVDPAHPGTACTLQMYLIGKLYRAQAADDTAAGRFRDALQSYVRAAGVFSCCAFRARAMTCLGHAAQIAARDSGTAESAILALARDGMVLQRQLGAEAITLIADMLRTSSGPFGTHLLPDIALLREQVAKGLLFSAALADPQPVHIDDRGETLLRQAATLGPSAPGPTAVPGIPPAAGPTAFVPDEALLTSVVASAEMTAGGTAAERRMNLQRSFDEHLTAALYTAADQPMFLHLDELRACLTPDTVFVSLFIGVTPGAEFAASHTQVVTATSYEYAMTQLPLPPAPVSRDVDGVTITYSIVASLVTNLRQRIQEDPMFDDVDPEASSQLELLSAWLGRFSGQIREWREAGHRHLVIWPHGPTHYLPWHLYRAASEHVPLADDWTVTLVPAIGMLGLAGRTRRHRHSLCRLREIGRGIRAFSRSGPSPAGAAGCAGVRVDRAAGG